MILKVRLEAMNKYKKTKYLKIKRFLPERYFKFLSQRKKEKMMKELTFKHRKLRWRLKKIKAEKIKKKSLYIKKMNNIPRLNQMVINANTF